MKEKYKILIVIILFLSIIMGLLISMYYTALGKYIVDIKLNWKIDIPRGDNKVYEKRTEPSFGGDGENYCILEYKNQRKISQLENSIEWNTQKDIELEKEIMKILNKLNVAEEYLPNLENEYIYYVKRGERDDRNSIAILKFDKRIYIIEEIL